jgi:hypothetical protein
MNTPNTPLYYVILSRPTGSNTWTPEDQIGRRAGNFFATKASAFAWIEGLKRIGLTTWIESEKRSVKLEYAIGAVVLTLSDTNAGNQ